MCYQRFNKEFSGPSQAQNISDGNNSRQNVQTQPTAFVANQDSNEFVATPESVIDRNRYPDSGASNHMTSDFNCIANPTDYEGNERVTIGDGHKLQISCVGNSCLTDGSNSFKFGECAMCPYYCKKFSNCLQASS